MEKIIIFFEYLKNIDEKILKIVGVGVKFGFVFCLIAGYVLANYFANSSLLAFDVGISLLQSGLFFVCTFIVCGVAFDKILKDV